MDDDILVPEEKPPYKKKLLLTKNEWRFYKDLKPIADKEKLTIIAKVRLADLVEVDSSRIQKNEYMKYFNPIAKKHVDFALCNPDNLAVIELIELDDNSHNNNTRVVRDNMVDKILTGAGYKITHVNNITDYVAVKNAVTENSTVVPTAKDGKSN
ncbi:MAG: DUF2726 domain-containing protein [Oscillospiraceae bacterium]|nr:DUF2726 domain-containing protein [Oscillospiraceae bacterium]MDY3937651.1 DUF2726 domain-containing protein [Oscillospiraceae bacterium]